MLAAQRTSQSASTYKQIRSDYANYSTYAIFISFDDYAIIVIIRLKVFLFSVESETITLHCNIVYQ